MSEARYQFLPSDVMPKIVARVEIKTAKPGRVTLVAIPYYAESRKRIPDAKPIQRTVQQSCLNSGLQMMVNLVEDFCRAHAAAIIALQPLEEIKKVKDDKDDKKAVPGVYSAAYYALDDPEVLYNGWKGSTVPQTKSYFERQILPRIDRLTVDTTRDQIDAIVNELTVKAKDNPRGGHDMAKAKKTVSNHLYRADIVLNRLHLISNTPLLQFGFHAPAVPQTEQAKALPPTVRIRFAAALRRLRRDPRAAGCALMFVMGHRTAEACAPLIKDFVLNRLGFAVYYVGYQIIDGKRVETLKSQDAYRFTVGGPLLYLIINARIEVLLDQGYTIDQVMEMPLVSDPDDPTAFLDPKKLSAYAKDLLIACGYTEEAVFAAQILMDKQPDLVDGEAVKEVSCYILRRDWVSRALNICGMDPRDVDYLVGHKRLDKSITVFTDPAVQFKIAQQLESCVLLPDCTLHPAFNPIVMDQDIVDFARYTQYMFVNDGMAKRIVLRVRTADGGENLNLQTSGKIISVQRKTGDLDRPDERSIRPIVLPPYSRDMMDKEIAIVAALDLTKFGPCAE